MQWGMTTNAFNALRSVVKYSPAYKVDVGTVFTMNPKPGKAATHFKKPSMLPEQFDTEQEVNNITFSNNETISLSHNLQKKRRCKQLLTCCQRILFRGTWRRRTTCTR